MYNWLNNISTFCVWGIFIFFVFFTNVTNFLHFFFYKKLSTFFTVFSIIYKKFPKIDDLCMPKGHLLIYTFYFENNYNTT